MGACARRVTGGAVGLAALALLGASLLASPARPPAASRTVDAGGAGEAPGDGVGCLACHEGIEEMHPEAGLTCVDCHGGDPDATTERGAHVAPRRRPSGDERVAEQDEDLAWRRFRNPMDLRVADQTCGECHAEVVDRVHTSLHGTTAGHLSDGYYEMGLFEERGSRYAVFPVSGTPAEETGRGELEQVPEFRPSRAPDTLAGHYGDLARKECLQCHLWSEGRGVQGRVGFDGDYRGEGCAACHVEYAVDGLCESGDRAAVRHEPGHPLRHELTRAPTTQTCATCHYGDASIGLHFRGLSQLPPGAPGGPDIPGTTDTLLNRAYYLDDPTMTPPDAHHERGMHCIDCHTANDLMGDGVLHGQMEHAVEIGCTDCHGTFRARATARTRRGTPLEHLRWRGDELVLTGKVTGREHVVPQLVHVLDPLRPEFNARAKLAMTPEHEGVECYTCHAGWNVNFLGFHFTRNESLTQLDLLSGRRTPGRVTTQAKVFATWKSFYAGLNHRGAVSPYLTGFSTMGSVFDEDGELVLDQVMPVTSEGLSGMTMIPHQMHSNRPTARSCVECHRSSATWGLGSPNFRLGRSLAFVADRRGIEVVALDRTNLASSFALAKLVLPDVVTLELDCDDLQGHAEILYAAEGGRGVHVVDVRDPARPRRLAFVATVQPRGMELAGTHLYVADGEGGLKIFDVSEPSAPVLFGHLPMFDAYYVDVQWPWAYVADGVGGLAIVDVRAPIAPTLVSALDLNGASPEPNAATAVRTLFQYSRPRAEGDFPVDVRDPARHLCALVDQERGLVLVDVTEPARPYVLYPVRRAGSAAQAPPGRSYRGLVLQSHVDLAERQGGEPTRERDYAYLLVEDTQGNGQRRSAIAVLDVSQPRRVRLVATQESGYESESLTPLALYNAPFLQTHLLAPGDRGVFLTDVSDSKEPAAAGVLAELRNAYAVAVEEFPLDRMVDESGRRLKDVSHEGSRWLYRSEVERILTVPGERIGTIASASDVPAAFGLTARMHLASHDADGSGFLEGDEVAAAGGPPLDTDDDGRVSLFELADGIGLLDAGGSRVVRASSRVVLGASRTDPDGDLARLFDGVNPYEFDEDGNEQLDRRELRRAAFRALDLDGSGALSMDELSRCAGTLRTIRFGDERGRRRFDELDRNGDGRVTASELRVPEADWEALDVDRDGGVQLPVEVAEYERRRGYVGPESEWPGRRVPPTGLPPAPTVEGLLAVLDANGDGELSRRELGDRRDLLSELDRDRDGSVSTAELAQGVARVQARGPDAVADGFEARWDVDGDGRVELGELPGWVLLRVGRPDGG